MRKPQVTAVLATLVVVTAGITACSSSDDAPDSAGASARPSASPSPTPTRPAHDLRVNSELEAWVAGEWRRAFADPAGAYSDRGLRLRSVACKKVPGGTRSTCRITATKGLVRDYGYLVAPDGSRATVSGID